MREQGGRERERERERGKGEEREGVGGIVKVAGVGV